LRRNDLVPDVEAGAEVLPNKLHREELSRAQSRLNISLMARLIPKNTSGMLQTNRNILFEPPARDDQCMLAFTALRAISAVPVRVRELHVPPGQHFRLALLYPANKSDNHVLNMWPKLRRCFAFAEVELSNNLAENSMRPLRTSPTLCPRFRSARCPQNRRYSIEWVHE
jgi:hypothetical protein